MFACGIEFGCCGTVTGAAELIGMIGELIDQ
jgi:hypothetical protein